MAMSPSTTTLQQPAPPAARPVPEDGSAARTVASPDQIAFIVGRSRGFARPLQGRFLAKPTGPVPG
jgi:hypothetical protein